MYDRDGNVIRSYILGSPTYYSSSDGTSMFRKAKRSATAEKVATLIFEHISKRPGIPTTPVKLHCA